MAESTAIAQQATGAQPCAALPLDKPCINHTPAPHPASTSVPAESESHISQARQHILQLQHSDDPTSELHHAEATSARQLSGSSSSHTNAATASNSQERALHTHLEPEGAETTTAVSPSGSHSGNDDGQGQAEPSADLMQNTRVMQASAPVQGPVTMQDSEPMQDSALLQGSAPMQDVPLQEGSEASLIEEHTLQSSPESSFVSSDAGNVASFPIRADTMPSRTPLAAVQDGYSAAVRSQMSKQSSLQEQGNAPCNMLTLCSVDVLCEL